jgi:hypothetical protein
VERRSIVIPEEAWRERYVVQDEDGYHLTGSGRPSNILCMNEKRRNCPDEGDRDSVDVAGKNVKRQEPLSVGYYDGDNHNRWWYYKN